MNLRCLLFGHNFKWSKLSAEDNMKINKINIPVLFYGCERCGKLVYSKELWC